MRSLWQDLRSGMRSMRRNPWVTGVMVATLALGIGANAAIFSVINGVLLQPLPYAKGSELFRLVHSAPAAEVEDAGVSVQEMRDYREQNRTLVDLVEYHSLWFSLLDRGEPERVQSGVVSWNFFQVMGVEPILGRAFTAEEDRVGAPPVLVLGNEFWRSHFGGDPAVIGRTVEMNDQVHTIVGVLPPLPQYPDDNDVWMPWYACPFRAGHGWEENRAVRALTVLGRVRGGVELEAAERDVGQIAARMVHEHPESYPRNAGFQGSILPLEEELTREARPTFLVLLAMSGFVLLIACANVANLALARLSKREQELAVRAALGAGRGRLARQLLTESLVLAGAGGALGLLVAFGLVDLLAEFSASFTPRAGEVQVDGWVLLFTLLVTTLTGLGVGTFPALVTRGEVAGVLREGSRASASAGSMRLRGALVVVQLAVTFVLLIGAGLMIRSFVKLQRVEMGFDPENVLTAQVDLDWATYTDASRQAGFWSALLDRAGALPGVATAGVATSFPLNGGIGASSVRVEGQTVQEGEIPPRVGVAVVSPGYFGALRIPLLQGRDFLSSDDSTSARVVVVSGTMARHFWPDRTPIGQRVSFDGESWLSVVGVVGDVTQEDLASEAADQMYLPLAANPVLSASVVLRTQSDPARLGPALVEAVRAIDPRQPVAFVRTLREVRSESMASPRLTTLLLGLFATLALAISLTGVLGVVAFSVSQRTREIGIRVALGQMEGSVVWLILRRSLAQVAAGLALGVVLALQLARWLEGLLFGVAATDPPTYVAVALVLLATAAAASHFPARRATRVSPMVALRTD